MEKAEARPERRDLPEWLLETDEYIPTGNKDGFINKSILTVLGVISRIRSQSMISATKYQINASVKLLCALMLVVFVVTSRQTSFLKFILAYELVTLCLMPAPVIKKVLRVSISMSLFTFIIMVPALIWGNVYSCEVITVKVFLTVTAVNLLSYTTRWNDITNSLKRVHFPDMFIFVLDITIKYIVMLGDLVLNMLYALKLRSVGKSRSKYGSLSGVAGTAYIKSQEMAVEMYHAMECRGFEGEYRVFVRGHFKWTDAAYLLLYAGITALFIFYASM